MIDEDTRIPGASQHLSELVTCWTTVRTAHIAGPEGQAAMSTLIGRYHDAIERYLRIKLRDQNLADEVLQEFWTKLLTHKLAGADDSKGRFRDYLRTVIHRLIIDHFRGRKVQALPPGDLVDPADPDTDYDRVWKEVVLKRVWSRLDTYEASTPKNKYSTVLKLRVDNPDASIDELADRLTAMSEGKSRTTSESFRKTLQRARAKFLDLLILELKSTIHPAEPEDIESEIFDLGLGTLYKRYKSGEDSDGESLGRRGARGD
ncbi:MAG: sigma-70 family RNA polymerase sigma factor [Isosphaeraceae bacterium]|nr:sigma-70 family RNA polymerase sigma factor [Isosphaeraceae bacterium]